MGGTIFTFLLGVLVGIILDKAFISKVKITYNKTKDSSGEEVKEEDTNDVINK